ncbi:hypothetical protein D3C75_977160 [compost metagenome]
MAAVTAQARVRSLSERVAASRQQAVGLVRAAEELPRPGEAEAAPHQKAAGHKRQRQQEETGGIFPPVFLLCSSQLLHANVQLFMEERDDIPPHPANVQFIWRVMAH